MKDFILRNVLIVSLAAAVLVALAATGAAFAVDAGSEQAKPLTYMSIPF
ncbi:MAG: hypothetical protein M3Y70_03435 [Pseudomonadota bacterium]|nr:hypothetical protein [Pseudomonadota bacterium]